MLINLRNALMAGKRLPYDAEVEYLESTGTQYVNTGVLIDTSTDTVEITFMPHAETSGYQAYYGTDETGKGQFSLRKNTNGNNIQVLKNTAVSAGITADEKWHTVKVTPDKAIVDGVDIALTQADAQYTKPLMLFARITTADTITAYAECRIASFKIYRNGVLVRDFIPVRVGTVGYLYDRVSGALFGNAGTGDFVLGQDVVPVEYLRGDGSSAIETDIQWQLKAAYTEVDFRMPDARDSVSKRLLGSSAASFNYITARRATRADYFGFNAATTPLLELVSGTQYKGAAWYENDLYNFSLNDSVATYSTTVHGTAGSFCVFDITRSSYEDTCFKGDISAVRIYADKSKVQLLNNLQAVRVGTEGAMMDTLTRRIYRNAGTGAFSYGNDLKYPIPAE